MARTRNKINYLVRNVVNPLTTEIKEFSNVIENYSNASYFVILFVKTIKFVLFCFSMFFVFLITLFIIVITAPFRFFKQRQAEKIRVALETSSADEYSERERVADSIVFLKE
jgi:hypothetical protein